VAIQELNSVEIESVSGGVQNILTALPLLGPVLNYVLNGVGPSVGGELLTNPVGIVTSAITEGSKIALGVLGGVLAIVTGLIKL